MSQSFMYLAIAGDAPVHTESEGEAAEVTSYRHPTAARPLPLEWM
jgi:hypothetical protein